MTQAGGLSRFPHIHPVAPRLSMGVSLNREEGAFVLATPDGDSEQVDPDICSQIVAPSHSNTTHILVWVYWLTHAACHASSFPLAAFGGSEGCRGHRA